LISKVPRLPDGENRVILWAFFVTGLWQTDRWTDRPRCAYP